MSAGQTVGVQGSARVKAAQEQGASGEMGREDRARKRNIGASREGWFTCGQ